MDDLLTLSRSVPETLGPLIEAVRSGVAYIANPIFAGGSDVGGADGDFIIADTLFELKVGAELDAAAVRSALIQMVGYALLDYSDIFAIRQVAVCFARHRWVAAWSVAEPDPSATYPAWVSPRLFKVTTKPEAHLSASRSPAASPRCHRTHRG